MKKILENLKYIKFYDIISIFIFILLLIPSLFYKLYLLITRQQIWLITEDGHYARDNGYYFFKYMREKHKKFRAYYVIDKKSHDYAKVKPYGNIVQFRSIKHWIYYMTAKYNISSQKNGNPDQTLFYILHVNLNLFNNRVFLQHGITKDESDWIFYKKTKFKTFVCGAKREYEYVKAKFGYPLDNIIYTGFPRFDSLKDTSKTNQILIMPTWRNWLGRETNNFAKKELFKNTNYYKNWNGLINNPDFINFIEKNDIKVKFYPHVHMQKFLSEFTSKSKNIEIISTDVDIQTAMKESSIMITDFSSVAMDFAYMEKPIFYFQFDQKEYREKQLKPGYFDYEKDGFGPVATNQKDLIAAVKNSFKKGNFSNPPKYQKREQEFYDTKDTDNSSRVYKALLQKSKPTKAEKIIKIKYLLLFLAFLSCGFNVLTVEIGDFSILPMTIIAVIILLFKLIIKEKTRPHITKAEVILLILLLFAGANIVFSYDIWRSIKVLGRIVLVIFSIEEIRSLAYLIDKKKVKTIFNAVCVILLLFTIIYYICGITHFGFIFNTSNIKYAGTMIDRRMPRLISLASSDPNITAIFLAIPLAFYMCQKQKLKNIIMIIGFTALMALTISRGATVAIACMLLIFLIFDSRKFSKRLLTTLIVTVTFALTSISINAMMNNSVEQTNIISNPVTSITKNESLALQGKATPLAANNKAANKKQKNNKPTNKSIIERLLQSLSDNGSGRLTLWNRAIEVYKERPINGIGIGNFYTYTKIKYKYNKYAHNTYLEMLAETGIIGFTIFIVFIILIVIKCFNIRKADLSPFLLLSFLLPAIVFLSIFHHEVFYVALLYVAIAYDNYRKLHLGVKASVLLPTLNTNEQYLKKSITSILTQTHQNFEFIIVVDGGNDDKFITKNFKDDRITIIKHDKPHGIAKSLNEAIKTSTGKYLIRMDADDISRNTRLEEQIIYMEEHPEITVAGTFVDKFGDSKVFACESFTKPNDIYAKSLFVAPIIHPSVIMRASTIKDNKEFNYDPTYERAEDYELWRRIMESGHKISSMKYFGLYYRIHAGQVSTAKREEQSRILTKIYAKSLKDLHLPDTDNKYLFMLSGRSKLGNKQDLKKFVKKALLNNNKYKVYNQHSLKRTLYSAYDLTCLKNKSIIVPNIYFVSFCIRKAFYKLLFIPALKNKKRYN